MVKILIIEDDQDYTGVVEMTAKMLGYTVQSATNLTQAQTLLKQAEDAREPFDVATIDYLIRMGPQQREASLGKQIISYVRASHPYVGCIVLTGSGITADTVLDLRDDYDLDYYIEKTKFDQDSLKRAVEKALRRRQTQPESLAARGRLAFISYQRKATWAHARALANSLRAKGVAVFIDIDDISDGRFERVILEKIHECHYFLPLMAADTLSSPWVVKEITHALALQKAIIPILVDDYVMNADQLPEAIRALASYNGQPINAKFYDACIDHLVIDMLK
jgi:DNA-binding response OmpR family regulator